MYAAAAFGIIDDDDVMTTSYSSTVSPPCKLPGVDLNRCWLTSNASVDLRRNPRRSPHFVAEACVHARPLDQLSSPKIHSFSSSYKFFSLLQQYTTLRMHSYVNTEEKGGEGERGRGLKEGCPRGDDYEGFLIIMCCFRRD